MVTELVTLIELKTLTGVVMVIDIEISTKTVTVSEPLIGTERGILIVTGTEERRTGTAIGAAIRLETEIELVSLVDRTLIVIITDETVTKTSLKTVQTFQIRDDWTM
jgi:hypothetical protein